jgi:molecular chaperone DnaK (HSP70)
VIRFNSELLHAAELALKEHSRVAAAEQPTVAIQRRSAPQVLSTTSDLRGGGGAASQRLLQFASSAFRRTNQTKKPLGTSASAVRRLVAAVEDAKHALSSQERCARELAPSVHGRTDWTATATATVTVTVTVTVTAECASLAQRSAVRTIVAVARQ